MELVQQRRKRLQVTQGTFPWKLPPHLRFILSLLLGIMVVVFGTLALSRFSPRQANPFAVYDEWINSNMKIARYDEICAESRSSGNCVFTPSDKQFAQVRLAYLEDEHGTDMHIYFDLSDKGLTVGHIALLWGRPTIVRLGKSLILRWPAHHISTVIWSENGQFDYKLPLQNLFIY